MFSKKRRGQVIKKWFNDVPKRKTDYLSVIETKDHLDLEKALYIDEMIDHIREYQISLKRVVASCIQHKVPEYAISIILKQCFNHTFTMKDI